MQRISIRKAKPKDAGRILELLKSTDELQGVSSGATDSEYNPEYVSASIADRWRSCVLVATTDDGTIIGLLTAELFPQKKFSWLTDIVVVPDYRHHGLGGKLFKRLERILKENHINIVSGITQKDNTVMCKFCKRHGLKLGREMLYFEKIIGKS